MSGCVPPRPAPWWLQAWFAGPMAIVGVFLMSYVGLGMAYLQPSLRILAALPGLALFLAFRRGIRRPQATALFWGGVFFAYAGRGRVPFLAIGGAAALIGAAMYLWAERRAR